MMSINVNTNEDVFVNFILMLMACLAIAEYLNIKLDFRPRWYARVGFIVGGVMLWMSGA